MLAFCIVTVWQFFCLQHEFFFFLTDKSNLLFLSFYTGEARVIWCYTYLQICVLEEILQIIAQFPPLQI